MKTAMQLAIKKFKSESNLSWESGSYTDAHAYDFVVQELTNLLEKEKEQIMFSYHYGKTNGILNNKTSEQFYNQTYKNQTP